MQAAWAARGEKVWALCMQDCWEAAGVGPHLVHVIAELALGDGPWPLVVPLERGNLRAHNGRLPAAIVVHAPVVHARQEVCMWAGEEGSCRSDMSYMQNISRMCRSYTLLMTVDCSTA